MKVQHKSNTKVFFAKYYLAQLLITNRVKLSDKQLEILESIKRFVDRNEAITEPQNRLVKQIYNSKCPIISDKESKFITTEED